MPYSYLVRKGYPVFLTKLRSLKRKGVNVVNGVKLFDKKAETIYIDACCHFNELGNEILADFIFRFIPKNPPTR